MRRTVGRSQRQNRRHQAVDRSRRKVRDVERQPPDERDELRLSRISSQEQLSDGGFPLGSVARGERHRVSLRRRALDRRRDGRRAVGLDRLSRDGVLPRRTRRSTSSTEATEGTKGGRNWPANPDDDGDGRIDEDWLNGRDDDGDGRVDEDFAAVGKLMYSCWFTDDQAVAQEVWPEHVPLGLKVRQETYQWSEESSYNSVGVRYTITNEGCRYLQNVYVGIYADLDAGPRNLPSYYKDDQIGSWAGIWCAPIGGRVEMPERISTLYVYDNDGDDGRTKGYFGIVLLGSRMLGRTGPKGHGRNLLRSIRIFAGLLPYERGGEPINDFQRYELLSNGVTQPNTTTPNDYKALMSVGPFFLGPGQTIELDFAYSAGEGLDEISRQRRVHEAHLQRHVGRLRQEPQHGRQRTRGDLRRRRRLREERDLSRSLLEHRDEKVKVPARDTSGSTTTASRRRRSGIPVLLQGVDDSSRISKRASTAGRRGCPGSRARRRRRPGMRAVAGDGVVGLIWDNLSEITPDAITQQARFRGLPGVAGRRMAPAARDAR